MCWLRLRSLSVAGVSMMHIRAKLRARLHLIIMKGRNVFHWLSVSSQQMHFTENGQVISVVVFGHVPSSPGCKLTSPHMLSMKKHHS
jgi:hypothetical protein